MKAFDGGRRGGVRGAQKKTSSQLNILRLLARPQHIAQMHLSYLEFITSNVSIDDLIQEDQ